MESVLQVIVRQRSEPHHNGSFLNKSVGYLWLGFILAVITYIIHMPNKQELLEKILRFLT